MDPAKAPYNFTSSPGLPTQGRAGLKYLRESWTESRAPKLAFIFPDNLVRLHAHPGHEGLCGRTGLEVVGQETWT